MLFAELVFVQGLLGRFGREIGIQEEVFYACDLRNFVGEELCSKPCAENLDSGMTSGLVELAVEIILELVPGPGISFRPRTARTVCPYLGRFLGQP
ncbi:hypothetical protein F2Q68_00008430 [Brassica cretica]|uniref:Uncharacterized protein n=1 Tax=Brassica cretica TaxID=69181 RepID=A0A8S9KSI2_BRACR|nr:hypothetical protein F2Q68_00008430 [Brassica cretica]